MRPLLMIWTLACLVLSGVSQSAFAAPAPAPAEPDAAYFTKLRLDFAAQKDFNPMWHISTERDAIRAAFKAGTYQKAFDLAGAWLAQHPVDGEMHMLRSTSADNLGDSKNYVKELYFAYGLLQSIAQSGDGLTPKTAFKVIGIPEEYDLLHSFGLKVTHQSVVPGPCDKMECEFPDGKKVTYYFDITISLKALSKQLGH